MIVAALMYNDGMMEVGSVHALEKNSMLFSRTKCWWSEWENEIKQYIMF